MTRDSWERPATLRDLKSRLGSPPGNAAHWSDVVARCRAAATLARIERAVLDGVLVTDGVTDGLTDVWPADFSEAFQRLGHADKYGTETAAGLHGLFDHMSQEQLAGLTNAVKGTVMEIRVRDMIQAGQVPGVGKAAQDAYLSTGLTQTGHDVEIVDAQGDVIETLQVKSGGWSDVRGRIEEYAADGIPVAVTSETAEKAESAGYGDAVIDTGISGQEIAEQTAAIVDNLGLAHAIDELMPEFAVVALVAAAGLRIRSGQSVHDVQCWLTNELKQMGVANAAGVAVQLLTGMVVFRPIAILGTRWGVARARTAGESVIALRATRDAIATIASKQATAAT